MLQFRVDDFPHTKGEPQHTREAFRDFHRALRDGTGGRQYLLGVIPGRCTDEDWSLLREIQGEVVLGMHGIMHDEAALDRNCGNEFAHWYTQKTVQTMLLGAHARFHSHGLRCLAYMPPRNVIDRRTLRVLPDIGFVSYTGGPETDPECKTADYLTYIHSQPPHEYGRTDEMSAKGTEGWLNKNVDRNILRWPTTVALHWTWETNIGLDHLKAFLGRLDPDLFMDFAV